MEKETAGKLIKKTFQNPFNRDAFVYFVKNLLNHIEEAPFIYRGNFIPDAFDPYIKTLERVGKYQDAEGKELDILIVRLKKETSLEHARTMQRNFIAWYLNGSRGGKLKEAALVAFVSPDDNDWRFSLVKMEYKLGKTKTGRVRAQEELTPARRYSFLVGVNESSHTAQRQLVPILEDDQNSPTIKQIEEKFNIEKVTKEFFEKYRDLYLKVKDTLDKIIKKNDKIKKDFKEKNVSTIDFSKKLLGQIVFLYFLQKKGWFGVKRREKWGSGSKDFLRELFAKKHGSYQNFFNDILEPLFYEALRQDRSHDDDYYSRFDCRIPFLNGGLFDPLNNYDWVNTDIILPNELFSNDLKTKEGDVGSGILDIFDRYNFTVKEDEPLEKEVAVDPEMLGKVFENLLEVKDRKSKGTYYTPREIVHYMCQESLINYLATELKDELKREDIETLIKYGETAVEHEAEVMSRDKETKTYSYKLPKSIRDNAKAIDEKLINIRACDPAVGSGAFLVGMMNEIIRARNALIPFFKDKKERTVYNFKRHAIQNCLYGVDIDPGAVEIAKLRLWLSLVVDEADIKQIKPLPNLDYKIVWGNSLLGVEKNLFNANLFSKLEELKPLFFNEANTGKKQEYKKQIDELINQITNGRKDFDFEIYFSEVFHEKKGFDVVIGNPPYGFRNVLTAKEKEYFRKKENIEFKSGDSAELFCKKCFDNLVKTNGVLTFIIPKKSLYGDAWDGLRKEYWNKYNLIFLLDSSKAFENVLLEQNAFSLSKNIQNKKVELAFLNKNDEVIIFSKKEKSKIFMDNGTVQIYKELYPSIFEKVTKNKISEVLVSGDLGLAIGTNFFSSKPTKYKLLKGIDIKRWRIKQNRYLKNEDKLKKEDLNKFLHPKTICQRLIAHIENPKPHIKITACYDSEGIIISNTLTAFKIDLRINEKFWLAYLNSIFINWYTYNLIYSRAIRTMDFYSFYIQQIPIPKIIIDDKDKQKPINELVDKILAITKDEDYLTNSTKQAKVADYEKQINEMVYKLYGLTKEEIKIVENG
jgi:hypothetical protein